MVELASEVKKSMTWLQHHMKTGFEYSSDNEEAINRVVQNITSARGNLSMMMHLMKRLQKQKTNGSN